MVTLVVVCRRETCPVTGMDMKRQYVGGENIEEDMSLEFFIDIIPAALWPWR